MWEMTVKRTRLCYWIALPVEPGMQSSNNSRVPFTVILRPPVCFLTHMYCIYGTEISVPYIQDLCVRKHTARRKMTVKGARLLLLDCIPGSTGCAIW